MLVGRDSELRQLGELLAGARLGRSGVVVIIGEPGIGKTALLAQARGSVVDMRVLTVTGNEAERDLAFAGLAQLLRLGPTDLARLPEPQAQALGVALALREGGSVDRFAVGAGLLTLLTQRSEDGPIALFVDDAHLLDRPSQEALAFVARRLLADAVALVATARAGEPCALVGDLPQLRLNGIDAVATGILVRRELGGGVPAELSDRVFALAQGNPLAIGVLTGGYEQLVAAPPDAPILVPASLAEAYSRRAAGLSPSALIATLVVAAAGEDLGEVGRACAWLGIPVAGLAEAEAAGLLVNDGARVTFRHPLGRSGIYAGAAAKKRRSVHAAIAATLPAGESDRRAWHLSAAATGPDEEIAGALTAVARRAAGRGAHAVAATAAERAAALSPDPASRADRLVAAGGWAWDGGDGPRARQLLERAERLHPVTATQIRAGLLRGVIAARCGAVDEGRDVLLATGEICSDPDDALACYVEAVHACLHLGDTESARVVAGRIESLIASAGPLAAASGLIAQGVALVVTGLDGSAALRAGVARLATVDRSPLDGEPRFDASWAVLAPMFLRDTTSSRALIQRAVDERRTAAALGGLPHLLFHIARDEATTDRWSRAEADYSEGATLAREFGQSTELAGALAGLAWLLARQGRPEAAALAAEVFALAAEHHTYFAESWAHYALGDLALGAGDLPAAMEHYADLQRLLTRLGIGDVDLDPGPELAEALVRTGDLEGAHTVAARYAERAEAKGRPWALARTARLQLLLTGDSGIDEAYRVAADRHAATPDDFERARTDLAYGARLRRARRRVDARPVLRRALDTFRHLGARPWADAACDELEATGVAVPARGDSAISRLTPRELQIAVPLADGRTTREVAGALFLSPKTVEYHLRNVYIKLGIDSRRDLAALLAER